MRACVLAPPALVLGNPARIERIDGALWKLLYRHGVDVVLNGHEHNYERFALMNPAGRQAPRAGSGEFVVGTGGRGLYDLGIPIGGSQTRVDNRFGVLRMVLHPRSYQWQCSWPRGAQCWTGADTPATADQPGATIGER